MTRRGGQTAFLTGVSADSRPLCRDCGSLHQNWGAHLLSKQRLPRAEGRLRGRGWVASSQDLVSRAWARQEGAAPASSRDYSSQRTRDWVAPDVGQESCWEL